jgi:tripartite-type tricarboxylate transporter receptor subunit TctC
MQDVTRTIASAALAGLAAVWSLGAFSADNYPSRPIRLVIPFPPGGSNDIIGRLLGLQLAERLGRPVIIDNRAGAGGNLGIDLAAKAAPDGYTMLMVSAAFAFGPSMYQKLPFDQVKSFAPVAKIGTGPNSLAVFPGLPVKTARDLIALAKAKPGQLNFASAGVGSSVHLACELFKSMAQIDVVHIPFKGGGPAIVDVVAGNSQFIIGTLIQNLPHMRSGKLRGIGIAAKKRVAAAPELPTIDESGLPGYEAGNWWGIMFPARTPPAIVARMDREIAAILQLDEIKKRFVNDGTEPDHVSGAEFASFIAAETAKWGRVVKAAGIKPQ